MPPPTRTPAPPVQRLPADTEPRVKSVVVVTAPAPARSRFAAVAGFVRRNQTLVLFAAGLLALDWGVGRFAAVWERHSPDDYAARVEGCRAAPRDFVIVGGSPVAEGLNPDRIASGTLQNGYAVGLSGGTTSDFYHAVRHACPTPPKVLVYGITASDLNDSRHEPHGAHSLLTWGDWLGWVRLRPESAEWVTRHFVQGRLNRASNLFRYRHGIRMWAATQADELKPGSCPESMREADELREYAAALATGSGYAPARGFSVGRYDAAKAAGVAATHFPYLDRYRTGSHAKFLHKLIDWCDTNGVKLILLDMPTTADLEATCAPQFAEYRRLLAAVEAERGLTVLRPTREAVGLTDAEFADLIHLNRGGAEKLSGWLRNALPAACGESR